jgi:hypothetical protein
MRCNGRELKVYLPSDKGNHEIDQSHKIIHS